MFKYLVLFVLASAFSFLLTPLVRFVSRRLGAIDLPGERKVHGQPIPRLGGLAIFVGFNVVLVVSPGFDFFYFPVDFLRGIHFGWLFVASAIVLCLGAVDDFRRMPSGIKLFFQIIAGLIVALSCSRIKMISLPYGTLDLGIWSVPVTVLWVVGITNAMNLLDGLDGLAAGTSLIVCMAIFGISLIGQNVGIALVSVILAGSILGFLKYNFHPASIFLGDSGAYFLGFMLSVLTLLGSLKGTTTFVLLIPILALGLPILDTAFAMLRRLLKSLHIMEVDPEKNVVKFFYLDGWSMFKADRNHIHHRLLQLGFTQGKAVMLLYAVSLILGGLALSLVYFKDLNYALLITTIGIAAYIGIRRLGYSEFQILSNGALLPLFDVPVVNRRFLRVFVDMGLIAFSYYLAFLLRFEGEFNPSVREYYVSTLPLVLSVKVIVFYFIGLYKGAWRYTDVGDLIRMVKAVVLGCLVSGLLLWMIPGIGVLSRAALLIDFNLLLFLVIGARSSFRILQHLHASKNHQGRKVLIYGVGKKGVYALRDFLDDPALGLSPVGFVDDDLRNQGKHVNGYPVLGTLNSLENIVKKNSVSEVILSTSDIPKEKLERLSQICSSHQIPLRRFQTRLEEISN